MGVSSAFVPISLFRRYNGKLEELKISTSQTHHIASEDTRRN